MPISVAVQIHNSAIQHPPIYLLMHLQSVQSVTIYYIELFPLQLRRFAIPHSAFTDMLLILLQSVQSVTICHIELSLKH